MLLQFTACILLIPIKIQWPIYLLLAVADGHTRSDITFDIHLDNGLPRAGQNAWYCFIRVSVSSSQLPLLCYTSRHCSSRRRLPMSSEMSKKTRKTAKLGVYVTPSARSNSMWTLYIFMYLYFYMNRGCDEKKKTMHRRIKFLSVFVLSFTWAFLRSYTRWVTVNWRRLAGIQH